MWENTKRFCNLPEAIIRKFELKHIWKNVTAFHCSLNCLDYLILEKYLVFLFLTATAIVRS